MSGRVIDLPCLKGKSPLAADCPMTCTTLVPYRVFGRSQIPLVCSSDFFLLPTKRPFGDYFFSRGFLGKRQIPKTVASNCCQLPDRSTPSTWTITFNIQLTNTLSEYKTRQQVRLGCPKTHQQQSRSNSRRPILQQKQLPKILDDLGHFRLKTNADLPITPPLKKRNICHVSSC